MSESVHVVSVTLWAVTLHRARAAVDVRVDLDHVSQEFELCKRHSNPLPAGAITMVSVIIVLEG